MNNSPPTLSPAGRKVRLVRDVPLERAVAALPRPLRQIVAAFRFEFARTLTYARSFVWAVLVMFPVLIMGLFRYHAARIPEEIWGVVLYGLIPQVVCLLGLLLWVSPLLNSELESRTWIYLAVRPGGKMAVLLGKYLNGALWTGSAALVGLVLAMLVGQPDVLDPQRLFLVLCLLVVCSCLGYGAVYAALGVLFPRRAIIISVAYMLIFEVLVSNIPAVINQFTVQYRLFNILLRGMDWDLTGRAPFELSQQPVWVHLAALLAATAFYLAVALAAVRYREYATADQSH